LTDLEKILREIERSAAREAEEILAKAKAEAEEILNEAKAEAAKQTAATEAETARQVAEIGRSGVSAQQRSRRERILGTKQRIISEVMQNAKEKLIALPGPDYFALLIELAATAATVGKGVVLLNENDRRRLPSDFEEKLSGKLPAGAQLIVSGETRPIDGGLILKYGGIEQNSSFDAIFNARRDEFLDLIRDQLFTGQEQ